MDISKRFKVMRETLGLSQKALAEKLNKISESEENSEKKTKTIPVTAISKYEQGIVKPSADLLSKLGYMGININWLLTGEGEVFVQKKTQSNIGEAEERAIEAIKANSKVAMAILMMAELPKEKQDAAFEYISDAKQFDEMKKRLAELANAG